MKKKAMLISTVAALVAVAVIGGTLAWFTATGSKANKVTTGKIALTVTEPGYDLAGGDAANTAVMPGTTITKDPVITNTGEEAIVGYKIEANITFASGETRALTTADVKFLGADNQELTGIVLNQWVTQGVMAKNASVTLFNKISFPEKLGNTYQGATVSITVKAQAVQSANIADKNVTFTDNAATADGKTIDTTTGLNVTPTTNAE